MADPLVTIVTGCYNRAPQMARTLDSLLGQTFTNFQLFVFDDASTDDSWQRLSAYNDPRLVTLRHDTNQGWTKGLINAIASTHSKYIAVQDFGDVSLPTRIEKQVALLEARPEIGVVGCHYTNVIESAGLRRPRKPNAEGMTLERMQRANIFSHGEVMYRRAIYEKVGGYRPEFKYGQDRDLWLRCIRHCAFATVPETLYERYITFKDGMTYNPEKSMIQMRMVIMAKQLSTLPEAEQAPLLAAMEQGHIKTLVPLSHPELQKKTFFAALRLIAFGQMDLAREQAQNLTSPLRKILFSILWQVFETPLRRPLRAALNRASGLTG